MPLFAVGLNHTTAPLDVREQVVFPSGILVDALRDVVSASRAKEAAILSTCNRTEVYFEGDAPAPVASWLARFHGVTERSLAPHCYTLPRDETVTHAFRVASGLDSMGLGEPQILGQMKRAVRSAESAGSLGLVLNRLFQRTPPCSLRTSASRATWRQRLPASTTFSCTRSMTCGGSSTKT